MKASTIILALLVIITGFFAWVVEEEIPVDSLREREGQPIGRADRSATDVRDLELITWDSARGGATRFRVTYTDGEGWVIPSHHNYPADAGTQVGRTAGSVLGKVFGYRVSNKVADHARLGVLDPADTANELAEEGHGTRIILRDKDKAEIIDLIIGKENEAKSGSRFVRETGSDAVYSADIQVVFSTRFTDWVNRGLIELDQADVRTVRLDRYSVDEQTSQIKNRDTHTMARLAADGDWAVSGSKPEGQVLDTEVVDKLLSRAADLELLGVRPLVADELYLQTHGLFRGSDNKLYGNEGALFVTTDDGLQYQLYFGEIAPGEGLALSAGVDGEDAAAADAEAEADGDNRYLAIIINYDPNSDSELQAAIKAKAEADVKAAAGGEENDGEKTDGDEKTDTAEVPDPQAIQKQRVDRINKLNDRFLRYFYVIDNASFYELRPDPETLFTEPPPPEEKPAEAGLPAPPAPGPAPAP